MILTEEMCKWEEYAEWYPTRWEEGYDGVHDGGFIRMKPGAPKWAIKDCKKYLKFYEDARYMD